MSASPLAAARAPLARPARHHRGGHRITLTPSRAVRGVARAASPLDDVRAGDLISLDFGEDEDAKETRRLIAREWLLEVTETTETPASVRGICRGRAFVLDGTSMRLTPAPEPSQPDLASEPWVQRAYPEWHALLRRLEVDGRYPAPTATAIATALPNKGVVVSGGVTKITSYDELKARVAAEPGFWRDGTPPRAPPMTVHEHATLNAGEILATLRGHRGVVMCQLWAGWEDADSDDANANVHVVQPVDAPFVTRALRDAAVDALTGERTIGIRCVPIAGMDPSKGLTALVHASKSPFAERAKHLATFGAQAALVAGSPYYQLLVGRILGYDARNIEAHVAEKGGVLTAAIVAEVAKDLAALAPGGDSPTTPWRDEYGRSFDDLVGDDEEAAARVFGSAVVGDEEGGRKGGKRGGKRRGKKKGGRSTASSVADAEAMFGRRGR